jgi:predicted HicB family RNase H-like nuclease
MKIMKYKNYLGSMEISEEDGCLFGKLLHINDLIMYQGQTVTDLRQSFERAVDDYLVTCEELGWEPKKPCSGTFNVRIGAEMHLAASEAATLAGVNLNEYVKQAIQEKIDRADRTEVHIHNTVYTSRFTTTLSDEGHGVIDEPRFTVKSSTIRQETTSRH